jgi:hypothetical protein
LHRATLRHAEDRADPHVGVLQIRRGVALEAEDLVPGKGVVALPVREEIGILHRAETDDARDLPALVFR